MTIDQVLTIITRAAFVVIALILSVDYLRFRNAMRRDALFMFASLAVAIVIGQIAQTAGVQSRVLTAGSAILIVAQPLLLLRLVEHFQAIRAGALIAAAAGFLLSAMMLAVIPPPLPAPATIAIVVYFAATNAYSAFVLLRAGRESTGVLHRRLVLIGQGTGLLAAVILLAGIQAAAPAAQGFIQPVSRLLALLATVWYYLGFTPPARLRRTWQLNELYAFLAQITSRPVDERVATILDDLCRAATRAGGGLASIALIRTDGERLVVRATTAASVHVGTEHVDPVTTRAMRERRAIVASRRESAGVIHTLASALDADIILAALLGSPERAWGVLIVIHSRASLFPEDDLELLRLLGEQAALVLDVGQLVSEQTALIEQLHESTRRLEATNQELEAFSYSVAHDLRAPLRAMDGFSKLVVEEHAPRLPREAQRHLQLVREGAQQMGRLIDDLLSFSRLARQPVHKQRVDTTRLVRQLVAQLKRDEIGERTTVMVGDLPECTADPALLRQAFANLLSNAVKFSRTRAEPRVEILARTDGNEPIYLVRDNGVGFDMRYADKLFRVFQRLHRAEEYEGTGVGLAIVQRVIHRHGGRVWADAEVDKGATFYFTLGGEP